jgi:hypothetical protein
MRHVSLFNQSLRDPKTDLRQTTAVVLLDRCHCVGEVEASVRARPRALLSRHSVGRRCWSSRPSSRDRLSQLVALSCMSKQQYLL